jgi:hypothetical protein
MQGWNRALGTATIAHFSLRIFYWVIERPAAQINKK